MLWDCLKFLYRGNAMKKKWMFAAAIVLFLIGGCMQVRAAEEECPDGLLKIEGK